MHITLYMKRLTIKISGKVQGVFFRASAKDVADTLGIAGFVKNATDGSVYIEAEGDEEKLNQFVGWCHQGPSRAVVESVDVEERSIQGFTTFEVKRQR